MAVNAVEYLLRRAKVEDLLREYDVYQETPSGRIKVTTANLAKMIMKEYGYHFKTLVDKTTNKSEIVYYKKGYYHRGGEAIIRKLINELLEEKTNNIRKSETLTFIKDDSIHYRDEFEPDLNFLCLKNGVYDIDNDKLLPHSPKYGFVNQLPVTYDKDKDCPKIKQFMKEIFPGKYKKYIDVVQEMFGYTLFRKYHYPVAFILYGRGRNGKSTCVNLLKKLIGKDNYSTRELHDLVSDRFATADLYGKMANICTEISSRTISDSARFKALTGDDDISGMYKYMGTFNFKNYAKLIFNANEIPKTNDTSYAFYQRWKIIIFSRTFPRGDSKTKIGLADIICTEDERSGLFNWAIQGLHRLRQNGDFTKTDLYADDELYELLSNPEVAFIEEYLVEDSDCTVSTEDVYKRYVKWAKEKSFPYMTKTLFSRRLIDILDTVKIKVEKRIGQTSRVYENLRWKDSYSPVDDFLNKLEQGELKDKRKGGEK